MATAQKTKVQSVSQANVCRLAPLAIGNCEKSIALMKDVTGLLISSILYYRKIIPEEAFIEKRLGVHRVKILRANTNNTMADNFGNVIFSAFDAIDLGYLKKLSIIFLENDQPVEIHKIFFDNSGENYKIAMTEHKYSSNPPLKLQQEVWHLKDQIFHTVSNFIQTLSNIKYVMKRPSVSFKLDYFSGITPVDYHPALFEPLDGSKPRHRLFTQPINFGCVATPFHSLELKSQFKPAINKRVINYLKNGGRTPDVKVNDRSVSFENIDNTLKLRSHKPLGNSDIQCACMKSLDVGILIKCNSCAMYQHIFCYDILTREHQPNIHICDTCALNNSHLKCIVPELCEMDIIDKQERSLFRLALGLCYLNEFKMTKEYLVDTLNLDNHNADGLLNKMKFIEVISDDGSCVINKRRFGRITIPKYFQDHSVNNDNGMSPILKRRRIR